MKKITSAVLAVILLFAATIAFADNASNYWIATISSVEASQEYLDAAAIIYGGESSNYCALNAANALLNTWSSNISYKVYTQLPDLAEEIDKDEIVTIYDSDLGFVILSKGLFVLFDIRMSKKDYYTIGDALEETMGNYLQITVTDYQ